MAAYLAYTHDIVYKKVITLKCEIQSSFEFAGAMRHAEHRYYYSPLTGRTDYTEFPVLDFQNLNALWQPHHIESPAEAGSLSSHQTKWKIESYLKNLLLLV